MRVAPTPGDLKSKILLDENLDFRCLDALKAACPYSLLQTPQVRVGICDYGVSTGQTIHKWSVVLSETFPNDKRAAVHKNGCKSAFPNGLVWYFHRISNGIPIGFWI